MDTARFPRREIRVIIIRKPISSKGRANIIIGIKKKKEQPINKIDPISLLRYLLIFVKKTDIQIKRSKKPSTNFARPEKNPPINLSINLSCLNFIIIKIRPYLIKIYNPTSYILYLLIKGGL